jgi:hypothetical protein
MLVSCVCDEVFALTMDADEEVEVEAENDVMLSLDEKE